MLKNRPGVPHIEAPWMELIHLLTATADAPSREEGSHRIVNGPLQGREIIPRPVGPAKGICVIPHQRLPHGLDIVLRQNAVRIEENQIVASCGFASRIPRWTGTGIILIVVMDG